MMYARIAIGVTALITMIHLHKAKAQNKESFDGFTLVDQAGNISKPETSPSRMTIVTGIRCSVRAPSSIRKGTRCTSPMRHHERPSITGATRNSLMARF